MQFAGVFEAHFVSRAHRFQTTVEISAILGIGGPGHMLKISLQKEPIFGRRPVNELDQLGMAHAIMLYRVENKASQAQR